MVETLNDKNRRDINFHQPQVESVLPEHFLEQYPKLVTFLKEYYKYLALAAGRNRLDNIFYAKDAESTSEDFLDYLFYEVINGLGADKFTLPRLALKLAPQFTRAKGTEISVRSLFRFIFGVEADAFYPKTRIFTVGESEIGAESLRFLQDSYFYQILSIQVRSPLSVTQWLDIYKSLNHPAGFALFAQTRFETVAENISATAPISIADSAASAIVLSDIATITPSSLEVTTGIDSDLDLRFYTDRGIDFYDDSINGITEVQRGEFVSLVDVLNTNSPRFSNLDSDRFSDSSIQTMDEDIFAYVYPYGPDSA